MKRVKLGYVHLASWERGESLFPEWMRKSKEYKKEVKETKTDEIVLPKNKTYKLIIDYPLNKPAKFTIKTGKSGLTREEVVDLCCKAYREVYDIEDNTSSFKAKLGIEGGKSILLNREQSDGKYGIWGHVLSDLDISCMTIDGDKITLGVDS